MAARAPRLPLLLAATLAVWTLGVAAAGAMPAFAPLDRPGPALSVPPAALAASLSCEPSVRDAAVEPVLLDPATGVTPSENYSWNWEPALTRLGIPWCTYAAPQDTLGDIQTSGEYLVYAIRTMHAMAGRRIAVMGHSQGGMSMRWALRFWPDTRAMVDDVIGFSGSNHGTTVLTRAACGLGCPAAVWQQMTGSNFIAALNSGAETFAGISYSEIYTHTDEVVEPAGDSAHASAALHTGAGQITNVATQDLCPLDVDEHLTVGTIDPVAYALAIDALTHPGPADPARIPRSVCSQALMPGVNPLSVGTYLSLLEAVPGLGAVELGGLNLVGVPELRAEPALACYTLAGCASAPAGPPSASAPQSAGGTAGACLSRRTVVLHLPRGLRAVRVTANGRRIRLARAGHRLVARIALGGRGRTVTLVVRGVRANGSRLRQTHRYHPCRARP
jgi:hypothetical protein